MIEILDLVIPSTFSCRTDIPSDVTPAGACPEEGTCSGEGVRHKLHLSRGHILLGGSSSSSIL